MKNSGYVALCYHYIKSEEGAKDFGRLLGCNTAVFRRHIDMLKKRYEMISLEDVYNISYNGLSLGSGRRGALITFDDGLSDHYSAAVILAEYGIKGTFFIPTCILQDGLPANPNIVHYCIAKYGIVKFLEVYRVSLESNGLNVEEHDIKFEKGKDDPMAVIAKIKSMIKYRLKKEASRSILLHIYKELFLRDNPDAMKIMYLTADQIREMIAMGHSVGVHTHSHVSVAASELTDDDFEAEVTRPRRYIEETFKVPVISLSYPFGEKRDCLSWRELIGRTSDYKLAFTVEPVMNTAETMPLELGRYQPMSTDDEVRLAGILEKMISGEKVTYANSGIHK